MGGTARGEIHSQEQVCAHCMVEGHNPPACTEWMKYDPDVKLKSKRPSTKSPNPCTKVLPQDLLPRRSPSNSSRGSPKPPKGPSVRTPSPKREIELDGDDGVPRAKRTPRTEYFSLGNDDIDIEEAEPEVGVDSDETIRQCNASLNSEAKALETMLETSKSNNESKDRHIDTLKEQIYIADTTHSANASKLSEQSKTADARAEQFKLQAESIKLMGSQVEKETDDLRRKLTDRHTNCKAQRLRMKNSRRKSGSCVPVNKKHVSNYMRHKKVVVDLLQSLKRHS